MGELLELSVSPANLPFTILLGLVLLYWTCVILGALDIELFDVDLDLGGDLNADVGADAPAVGGGGMALLQFFHVGTVPLSILLSFFILSLWIISVVANYYLGSGSLLVVLFLLVPNVIASLFFTKLFTLPIRALFRRLESECHELETVIGKICTVKSKRVGLRGQAEVPTGGAPLLLNVRTSGGEVIERGTEAIIVDYDKAHHVYTVRKLDIERTT
jgi:hypothetical protein